MLAVNCHGITRGSGYLQFPEVVNPDRSVTFSESQRGERLGLPEVSQLPVRSPQAGGEPGRLRKRGLPGHRCQSHIMRFTATLGKRYGSWRESLWTWATEQHAVWAPGVGVSLTAIVWSWVLKVLELGILLLSAFVEKEEKLGSLLSSQDRASADYWGCDEVMQSCLVLTMDPGVSYLRSLKPWMSNKHRRCQTEVLPPHLWRARSKRGRQHSDVGGPDEYRDGEQKERATYKYIHKDTPDHCLGTEMKKVCNTPDHQILKILNVNQETKGNELPRLRRYKGICKWQRPRNRTSVKQVLDKKVYNFRHLSSNLPLSH